MVLLLVVCACVLCESVQHLLLTLNWAAPPCCCRQAEADTKLGHAMGQLAMLRESVAMLEGDTEVSHASTTVGNKPPHA